MDKPKEQQDKKTGDEAAPKGREEITSASIKNAHASGDGSMGRNESSIPELEEEEPKEEERRNTREQY